MKLEAVVFATDEEATKAYDSGRCDAYTTDLFVKVVGRPAAAQHLNWRDE